LELSEIILLIQFIQFVFGFSRRVVALALNFVVLNI
jgi:hypothetical protein